MFEAPSSPPEPTRTRVAAVPLIRLCTAWSQELPLLPWHRRVDIERAFAALARKSKRLPPRPDGVVDL